MSFYTLSGERIVINNTNKDLQHWIRCEHAVKELRNEGYNVSDSLREMITIDCNIKEVADTIRAILDDKTGFTAAMYGISLEED
ncbi:hypothetical protein [Aeromonas veronii]|uniref:hypothetical protein n=1 Tax=Aeromonas veronii TaxID=654 RepID=UPI002B46DDE7|nr:hypothetical protein [Aeromonas veronii]